MWIAKDIVISPFFFCCVSVLLSCNPSLLRNSFGWRGERCEAEEQRSNGQESCEKLRSRGTRPAFLVGKAVSPALLAGTRESMQGELWRLHEDIVINGIASLSLFTSYLYQNIFFIGKPLQAHSLQNQSLSVLGRLPNIWNHPLKRKSWWGISEWGILACVKDLSLYSLQADCWPSTDSYGSPLLQTVWSGNVSGCSSSLWVQESTIL